jgi:ubiquinol-cytochrome c reductase cytochrome c subunit
VRSSSSRNHRAPALARAAALPVAIVGVSLLIGVAFFAPKPEHAPRRSDGIVLTEQATRVTNADLREGHTLFDANCSTCHGAFAQGSALAPNLEGLGSATVDLWVSSGWMPLANPTSQPLRKPALFGRQQTKDIAYYVASLSPGGPSIPEVDLKGASVASGFSLFALNCAPCHTITGAGDALSNGITAPPLHGLTKTQVAEAIETGPGNMPRLTSEFTPQQVDDIVAYVTKDIEHPANPGGLGLGGVGPVAEGFMGLFVGVGVLVLVALWIGDRSKGDDGDDQHAHAHQSSGKPADA